MGLTTGAWRALVHAGGSGGAEIGKQGSHATIAWPAHRHLHDVCLVQVAMCRRLRHTTRTLHTPTQGQIHKDFAGEAACMADRCNVRHTLT